MTTAPIYTIGYGARDMEAFIAALAAHGIQFVIDVRSKPYSRFKPEFSQQPLSAHLQAHGIRYVFMGDTLGGRPTDPSCYDAEGRVDYAAVAQQPFYREGIDRLRKAASQGFAVTIMCSEGKPESCHRSHLIARTLIDENIEVIHIDETDRAISQEAVLQRGQGGQMSMPFLDSHRQTSRKRYGESDDPA